MRGGGRMEGMTDKELVTITIDSFMSLQRIKNANAGVENKELEYQIRVLETKLSALGVNSKDLTLE